MQRFCQTQQEIRTCSACEACSGQNVCHRYVLSDDCLLDIVLSIRGPIFSNTRRPYCLCQAISTISDYKIRKRHVMQCSQVQCSAVDDEPFSEGQVPGEEVHSGHGTFAAIQNCLKVLEVQGLVQCLI